MRTIKGIIEGDGPFTYQVRGQIYFAIETTYNEKKKRTEAIHVGPRGGKYLVVWQQTN
jgi:hypothetical protein